MLIVRIVVLVGLVVTSVMANAKSVKGIFTRRHRDGIRRCEEP